MAFEIFGKPYPQRAYAKLLENGAALLFRHPWLHKFLEGSPPPARLNGVYTATYLKVQHRAFLGMPFQKF